MIIPPETRRNEERHQPFECPGCGGHRWRMTDCRAAPHRKAYRRRRECLCCQFRITTYETADDPDVINPNVERAALLYLRDMIRERLNALDEAGNEPPIAAGLV